MRLLRLLAVVLAACTVLPAQGAGVRAGVGRRERGFGDILSKGVSMATSGMNAMKNAHTVAQKESCMGCMFVWGKVHAASDSSSGPADVKKSLEEVCSAMPDVFFDACDSMASQEEAMVGDYLSGMEIKQMCEYATLCWKTFPM